VKLQIIYLTRNFTRNPLRTVLTGVAVALPIVIFVLSTAVIDGIHRFLDNSSQQLRLVVVNRASIVELLPEGYRTKIEALDPTRPVYACGQRWLGGQLENDPRPLSTLAADPDSFPRVFPDYLLRPGELQAWQSDRQALIVGHGTAMQFGWKVGDRITINPSVPPYVPLQFHVVSDAPDAVDTFTLFCRRDYIRELLKQQHYLEDRVSLFFVKCTTAADLAYYRTAIDRQFTNSPDETQTQDEKTFMDQMISQQFDLPRNLSILSAITVLVAMLAAANTMSMNFRDRLGEYAALKSVGFGARVVLGIIQSESLMVCGVGGLLGALGPYIAFTYTPLREFTVPLIQQVVVRPIVCLEALGIALAIGVLAGAWPSWLAARLRPVEAFRLLE
jgi:putative ABC transport system permease protein